MSDVFGVAVYKKGKAPMLMTGFKSEQLAGILSEYLQISLEKLREEMEFVDPIIRERLRFNGAQGAPRRVQAR